MSLAAAVSRADRQRHLAGLALAVIGAILFSAKAIVAKLLYRHQIDAVLLITLRMLFSLPFFAALAIWQARVHAPLSASDRWRIAGLGLIGYYLSSFLDFLGLQYVSASLERLILFLTPSFVLLLNVFYLKRSISGRQWLSLAVAYSGIVLVFAHDLEFGGKAVWLGGGLVLGAAISYACYLIGSGEILKRVGSLRLVAYAMCVSTAAALLQFVVLRPLSELVQPAPVYWLSLINAVVCTVAPVIMTMLAVARIGAPLASQAGMIGPVSTLFLGFWMLGEPVTGWQLAGSALVMAGIYLLSRNK